jgi:hypothetical protein
MFGSPDEVKQIIMFSSPGEVTARNVLWPGRGTVQLGIFHSLGEATVRNVQ